MNNITMSGTKCMLCLLGLLVLALPAQAASFDCAKAGTKVEKLICGDVELSKLDEELRIECGLQICAARREADRHPKTSTEAVDEGAQWLC